MKTQLMPRVCVALWILTGAGRLVAESNTTNILDGVTNVIAGPYTLGDTGPLNLLLITNAAALTDTVSTIGNTAGAHSNFAVVTGSNSVWQSASNFFLGNAGSLNQLAVRDGARVGMAWQTFIGYEASSSNNVLSVSGSDTYLDMQWFHLGQAGPGNEIHVTDGAKVGRIIYRDFANNIGFLSTSSDNLLLLDGAGTAWITDGFRVGAAGARNQLVIRNGAHMTLGFITVGRESGSTENSVTVKDPESILDFRSGTSYLGFNGAQNQIRIQEGGQVLASQFIIGLSNASWGNRLEIVGEGSLWNEPLSSSPGLIIGREGPGNSVSVAAGGTLRPVFIKVGEKSSDNRLEVSDGKVLGISSSAGLRGLIVGDQLGANGNTAIFDGPSTIWSNRTHVIVGATGSVNRLVIQNGAIFKRLFEPFSMNIGEDPASRSNSVLIAGAGTLAEVPSIVNVGLAGSANRLTVRDGAQLNSGNTSIGLNCLTHDNVAFATGAGTVWSNGPFEVGFCSTNNSLIVSDGAAVLAGLVRSSTQGGISNRIIVEGVGSLLRASGDLIVGNAGRFSSLEATAGARIEGRRDSVGGVGSDAIATATGAGTTWSNSSLSIGSTGARNGVLFSDHAMLDTGDMFLGFFDESDGNILALSSGAQAIVRTNFALGVFGDSNQLSVLEGAAMEAGNVYIAASDLMYPPAGFSSDANILSVSGAGSTLISRSNLWVGYRGDRNQLLIADGAYASSDNAIIGFALNRRSNTVSVAGPNSVWINTNSLTIGSNSTYSVLLVAKGGLVQNGSAVIGGGGEAVGGGTSCTFVAGNARVLITDPGSRWQTTSQLVVGAKSIVNSLAISNGGTAAAGRLIIGESSGVFPGSGCPPLTNANRVSVDGGTLILSNSPGFGGSLDIRHGTLTLRSGNVFCGRLTITNGILGRLDFYGGTLRMSDVRVQNSQPLNVGDGFHGADLLVEGGDNLVDVLNILPHSRLRGWGGFYGSGSVMTNAGTIFSSGPQGPSLTVEGSLTQLPGSALEFELTPQDPVGLQQFVGFGRLFLDGSLRVRLRAGFTPAPTRVFRIVWANVLNGTFDNVAFGERLKTLDNLGSFLVNTNGKYIELSEYQTTDLDADGIEDAWAANYFGHTPLTPAERLADGDGDGLSNFDEFKAGTDPLDSGSWLKVSITSSNERARISFLCVAGKKYRVWFSSDLDTWSEVPAPTFAFPGAGICEWTDDGKDTGGLGSLTRFFRVTAE